MNANVKWLDEDVGVSGHVQWLGDSGMLGAAPSIIKKWFPERTDAEWDGLDAADQNTLLMQANAVEAQWNAKINEIRYNGGCDATKPGLLAGAMREHLLKNGGKLENMDDLGEKSFGPKDCAEWRRVFGKAPDQETVAKAIGLVTGSTSIWVKNGANGYTRQITLSSVCPSGFKLPSCPPPAGPTKCPQVPCGPNEDCVDGDCLPKCPTGQVRDPVTGVCAAAGGGGGGKSSGGGIGALGIILLAGAALGAIFLATQGAGGPASNPRQQRYQVEGRYLTPNQAWEIYVGSENPSTWDPEDVAGYVNDSSLTRDLDDESRVALEILLRSHILSNR